MNVIREAVSHLCLPQSLAIRLDRLPQGGGGEAKVNNERKKKREEKKKEEGNWAKESCPVK